MEDAAIRHPGQIAATIAGGRPRFATDGYICDMALFDLVAVNAISAPGIQVAARFTGESFRESRGRGIGPPTGNRNPGFIPHYLGCGRMIREEALGLERRTCVQAT